MLWILAISINTVRDWVHGSGFWGGVGVVFGLLFACGLGLPLPEDIPLIVSGAFLVHDTRTWIIVGTACWCGIIGGDVCLYWMSRRYGMNITRAPIIGKHVTQARIEHVEKLFAQYGIWVVAIGRLFAGIRGAMVITAGAIRYNFLKFIIADGLAAVVSGGLFMLLGHWLGQALDDQKIKEFKHWFIAGAIVLVCLFLAWIIWKRRTGGSISEKIENKLEARLEKKLEAKEAASPVKGKDATSPTSI